MRRDLKRDLGKVKRRLRKGPYHLSSVSFLFLSSFFEFYSLDFVVSNCMSKKIKRLK